MPQDLVEQPPGGGLVPLADGVDQLPLLFDGVDGGGAVQLELLDVFAQHLLLLVPFPVEQQGAAAVADVDRQGEQQVGKVGQAGGFDPGKGLQDGAEFLQQLRRYVPHAGRTAGQIIVDVHNEHRPAHQAARRPAADDDGSGEIGHAAGAEVDVASAEALRLIGAVEMDLLAVGGLPGELSDPAAKGAAVAAEAAAVEHLTIVIEQLAVCTAGLGKGLRDLSGGVQIERGVLQMAQIHR